MHKRFVWIFVLVLLSFVSLLGWKTNVFAAGGGVSKTGPAKIAPDLQDLGTILTTTTQNNTISNERAVYEHSNSLMGFLFFESVGLQGTTVTGAIPTVGIAMGNMIKTRPVGTDIYLADLIQHMPFKPQEAYAQGIGFKSLDPVLPLWKTFRDVVYGSYAIVFFIMGMAIMFRRKLGAQAIITVQTAIPHIFMSILGVTFSYAVAGFAIDLMYISIYFIIAVFSTVLPAKVTFPNILLPGGQQQIALQDIALSNNIFSNGLQLVFGGGRTGGGSLAGGAADAVGKLVESFFLRSNTAVDANGQIINQTVNGAGAVFGLGTSVIAALVFALAIFFAVVKTFFELLKSYVNFIITVVFAPLQLFAGTIQGKNEFFNWFKSIIASLAPFPVVITMIFLAMVFGGFGINNAGGFQGTFGASGGCVSGFQAPQITLGGNCGNAVGAIQGLIAMGVIMLIPEAVTMSKKTIGAKGIIDEYLPMIGQNLKKGWEGGNLVEGLNFTDTRKLPFGGLSAENLTRKGTMGLSGVAGGVAGGLYHGVRGEGLEGTVRGVGRGSKMFYEAAGDTLGDPTYQASKKNAEERAKKAKEGQTPGASTPSQTPTRSAGG